MDGLSLSTPQKSKDTSGNAITQPRSHPIPKFYIFKLVMEFSASITRAFSLRIVRTYASSTMSWHSRSETKTDNTSTLDHKTSHKPFTYCIHVLISKQWYNACYPLIYIENRINID